MHNGKNATEILLQALTSNSEDFVKIITPLGYGGTADYFISLGLDMPKEKILSLMNEYAYPDNLQSIPAKEGVEKTLKKLKERGAKLCVLTASPHSVLDVCLKRLGLFDLFDNVWSCDDFGTSKADPQIYILAAERMGERAEDVLFLDDNLGADKTAVSAGMKVCGVYDESSKDYEKEIRAATHFYIRNFKELLEIK